jgi:sulfate/thiosulfate transport system substrate-binding protein
MTARPSRRVRILATVAGATAAAIGLAACGGSSSGSDSSAKTIDVVGFAVIKSAYDALGEGFEKTPAGEGVTFKGSYGASGAQSRAVIAGQKADVVALSLTPDVDNIAEAGKVDPSWSAGPDKGIVSSSVVVLAYRKGNPKGIHGWADIVEPGVGIVTPDPGTSGAAKWNLLGAYSQALGPSKDKAAAQGYLQSFIKNVASWNDSGRTATEAFAKGTGDVLISYENEAIAARAAGVELEYVVPDSTFLIQNPAAVTKEAPPVAKEFLTYVKSPAGQAILGSKGFRPVDGSPGTVKDVQGANDPANPFPAVTNLVTVDDLGGWSAVNDEFFDKENGLVAKLRADG